MSTIVSPSLQTLQVLALIAAIVFALGAVIAGLDRARVFFLLMAGLVLVALALMFGG